MQHRDFLKPGIIFRGFMILAWILFLTLLGLFAISNASRAQFTEILDRGVFPSRLQPSFEKQGSPASLLFQYHLDYYRKDPPPIEAVMLKLTGTALWLHDPSHFLPAGNPQPREACRDLFLWIDTQLNYMARATEVQPADLKFDPGSLSGYHFSVTEPFSLPEISAWVTRERARLQSEEERLDFLSTLLLLMILGGFGSLLYLLNCFCRDGAHRLSVSAFLFRPIVGMLLGIAMLMVNMMLNTLLTDTETARVRSDALYLLAFAAGMLTDKAFALVERIASRTLSQDQDGDNA